MEPKTSARLARPRPCPPPPLRDVPIVGEGEGSEAVADDAASGGARNHRPPGDMRPEPLRLLARGWDCG